MGGGGSGGSCGGNGGSSGGGGGSSGGGGGSSGAGGQIPNPAWVSPVPSWYQSSEAEGGMLPVTEDSIFVEIMTFFWSIQFSRSLLHESEKPRDLHVKPRFKNDEVLDLAVIKAGETARFLNP
jgi:hypothetical protein